MSGCFFLKQGVVIKFRTDLYSVLSQSTCLTDGWTDGQTDIPLSRC